MLGTFDGVCLLCGGITFKGFSTATSPMIYSGCCLPSEKPSDSIEDEILGERLKMLFVQTS